MKTKRLFAVHLLNDFSGSPFVLRQALAILSSGFETHLFTSTPSGAGILSNIQGVINHPVPYRWSRNKLLTLVYYLWAQWMIFYKLMALLKKDDTVYINTLLPFGAALAAKLSGSKVIYHVHEVNIRPALLKSFLVKIAGMCAHRLIFVSAFVKDQFNFPPEKTKVIYNALPDQFVNEAAEAIGTEKSGPFTVLMLCSLKAYKGVYQFVDLARLLPGIRFILVLNTSVEERDVFLRETNAPANCTIYPVQQHTAQFYKKAHLVLNLSIPGQWLETFGMTVLEGMVYGLPAIVPPAGGVTELITDGVEGLHLDSGNVEQIAAAITRLFTDESYYNGLASAALSKAGHFSQAAFRRQIRGVFNFSEMQAKLIPVMEK